DSGATHNFMAMRMAKTLGLRVNKSPALVKIVNTTAKGVLGVVTSVQLQVGPWEGRVDFTIIELDNYELIFGLDFLWVAKVAVIPQLGKVLVMDEKQPCFVKSCGVPRLGKSKPSANGKFLAMQCGHDLKVGDEAHLVASSFMEPIKRDEVLKLNQSLKE